MTNSQLAVMRLTSSTYFLIVNLFHSNKFSVKKNKKKVIMPHLPKKEMLVVLVKQALFQTYHHRNMAQYWIDNFSGGRKQHHQQRICKKK